MRKVGELFYPEREKDKRGETLQLYAKCFVLIETNIAGKQMMSNTTRFPRRLIPEKKGLWRERGESETILKRRLGEVLLLIDSM